jgi:hypothetical protein
LVLFWGESILSLPGSCFLAFSFLLVHDILEEWKFLWVRDLVPERKKKWGKNEKRNSRRWGGDVSQGWTCLAGCMHGMGFSWLLRAIKGWFKGQSLNFICT